MAGLAENVTTSLKDMNDRNGRYSTRPIAGVYCNVAKIAFQCATRAIFVVQLGFCAKSAQTPRVSGGSVL